MIIEFIGAPGSGKTTLLPVVIDHFNSLGYNAYTVVDAARPLAARTFLGKAVNHLLPPNLRRPLLWQVFYQLSKLYRIRFILRNWKLVWSVWSHQKSRPITDQDREHVLYWFFKLVGYYEFLKSRARPTDVLVFDEGFIHRVVQLFASEVEEPDLALIDAYLDLLPRPDIVIFPDAPQEVCEKRVYARGIWERFLPKTPAQVSRFIANSHAIVNLAVGHIKTKGWTVLVIDNGGEDHTKSVAELHRKLSHLFLYSIGLPQFQPGV